MYSSVVTDLSYNFSFLLKLLLCSAILFPNSVTIIITNAFNSLSSKIDFHLSSCFFFRNFLMPFQLGQIALSSYFA